MKIAITGGTGMVGSYLIPLLQEENHEISVISRSKTQMEGCTLIQADPTKAGEWMDQLSEIDVIINLAGENIFRKRWTSKQKERLINSRVLTTINAVQSINKSKSDSPVIISISGSDYYPNNENNHKFKEDDEPGNSFLSMLCEKWEKPLEECNPRVRKIVFRMGVILSHTGKGAERMFFTHKFHIGGWIGNGKQIYSWIHINDVVNAISYVLKNEVTGTFNLIANNQTMRSLVKIGGRLMGRWTWTFVPSFLLKIILGERAEMLIGGRALSNVKLIDSGFSFTYTNAEDALKEIFANSKLFSLKKIGQN